MKECATPGDLTQGRLPSELPSNQATAPGYILKNNGLFLKNKHTF